MAAISSAFTCNSGSPPVNTTKRCSAAPAQATSMASASASAELKRPPPTPSMPTKSVRSEEHTSELQSLMRISYAVFCLTKKKKINTKNTSIQNKERDDDRQLVI